MIRLFATLLVASMLTGCCLYPYGGYGHSRGNFHYAPHHRR